MYMILHLQRQFHQCSTSNQITWVWNCPLNTPHSWHNYSSHKLAIRHQRVLLREEQNIRTCPQSSNYQKCMYTFHTECILINIPTMTQNAPTLLKCPATIKSFF
jgi:hypothetical protein